MCVCVCVCVCVLCVCVCVCVCVWSGRSDNFTTSPTLHAEKPYTTGKGLWVGDWTSP